MADKHPRPDRCRDSFCERSACVWFKAGYQDGHEVGFAEGFAAGMAAASEE